MFYCTIIVLDNLISTIVARGFGIELLLHFLLHLLHSSVHGTSHTHILLLSSIAILGSIIMAQPGIARKKSWNGDDTCLDGVISSFVRRGHVLQYALSLQDGPDEKLLLKMGQIFEHCLVCVQTGMSAKALMKKCCCDFRKHPTNI